MKKIDKLLKRSGILFITALMSSGCQKTNLPAASAIESPVAETTAIARESELSADPTAPAATITEPETSAASQDYQAENGLFWLEEGTNYTDDLDGDGIAETICYQTTKDEYYSYPEIYINDQLLYHDESSYGNLIKISLTDLDRSDGYRELCVYTTAESETTQTVSFLRYEKNSLKVLGDLNGSPVIGGAGLYYRGGIQEVKNDGTIVISMDTPIYGNSFGSYYVTVCFRLEKGEIREIEQDYYTFPTLQNGYVAKNGFTAMTEPGGSEAAFTVLAKEVVAFDGICIRNGEFYGRVTNSDGVSGWLINLEEGFPGDDRSYFEEVPAWG